MDQVSGDPDRELAVIEQAYRDGYVRFLKVAIAMLGDADRARDAVQETFARAIRSRRDLRRVESVHAWLWQTLLNVCRMEQRHRPEAANVLPDVPANGHAVDWGDLRAVVAALPERQRLVLFLRHYADLDYARIAAVVGVERGTVAATLHAAHHKIRQAIEEVPQ